MATSPAAPTPIQRRRRRAKLPWAHRDPPRTARGAKRNNMRASSTAHSTATTNPAAASWGAKRARTAAHSTATTNRPAASSWGAKRARTTAPGGRAMARSAGGGSRCCARDWENLGGEGPAGLIAERVLANDVADYVRFRAVCRSWRRCSPEIPRDAALDDRFLPRQWIMLDKARSRAGPGRHRFLNVSTGECIKMDLPELAGHKLLAVTPEGLLLLLHETTLVVRLLNPLTRHLTDLPQLNELLLQTRGYVSARNLHVYSVGLVADASAVAVCFSTTMVLAVAKPGDERWTVVDKGYMIATLPFAGRFYCLTYRGLMVLDMSSDQQPPRLLEVADHRKAYFSVDHGGSHLVDNGGELMLVHRSRCLGRSKFKRKYNVYRVDLDAGILIPAKGLNGRAVFMGKRRTISVSAGVFPSVSANTIYIAPECDGQTLGYNVVNGRRELCLYNDPFCPRRAVDCISYCIQGMGRW